MKLRVQGNQCNVLIEKMLMASGLNRQNYKAIGHLVAQNIGMIFCPIVDDEGETVLCFTTIQAVKAYEKKMRENQKNA